VLFKIKRGGEPSRGEDTFCRAVSEETQRTSSPGALLAGDFVAYTKDIKYPTRRNIKRKKQI